MRHLILAASIPALALALAAPAVAQPRPVRLPPPDAAERMGDRVDRVADAIMDIDLGPLVDAIDPGARRRGVPTSLGHLATRRDPYARARMHDEIAGTSAGVGAAAREAAALTPVLQRSLAQAMRDIDAAVRDARARRYEYAPPPPPREQEPGWRP
ncbi:MAG: hypothetical protein JWO81_2725 [Alphaproteobacteria bacterium]|nr:hypothetical protein [Alphaproteobacteria bacterium]